MITSTVIYDPTQPTTRYPGEQLHFTSIFFDMNRDGDAVVAYGGVTVGSVANTVYAAVRKAGGAWSAAPAVAAGVHVLPTSVAVGAGGAAVVTWDSFDIVMASSGDYFEANPQSHAASTSAPGATWRNSPVFAGVELLLAAVDTTGRAVAVGATTAKASASVGYSESYFSFGETAPGAAWSGPVAISGLTIPMGYPCTQLKTDDAGDVTFVYAADTYHLFETRGWVATNTWGTPNLVYSTGRRPLYSAYLDIAANGRAVVATAPSGYLVEAQVRPGPTNAWSAPSTLGTTATFMNVAVTGSAVNAAGQATVAWMEAGNTSTLYVNTLK